MNRAKQAQAGSSPIAKNEKEVKRSPCSACLLAAGLIHLHHFIPNPARSTSSSFGGVGKKRMDLSSAW
ncbi:hypothetical protein [Oryza sativa Japonica Group]|uniref:Uncharacterized protein n=2 Tax=Oryza sativa subsp. japonica TaxID=39947 RepID=Q5JM12_ORYSJ|nr:hypothetical protein [Oryza sativa Japonica Group]BAD87646.1 hypothetical protein [Oryza sativa Japonica Group]